jgi:hypothetical protein
VLGIVAFLGAHRPDAVGLARQLGEQRRQRGVGALGDVAIAGEHVFGAAVKELRIGRDELLELRTCAAEAGSRDGRVHARADARHFGEPEFVQLSRRHPGRRVEPQQRFVVRRAGRQRARTELLRRGRQVLRLVEALQRAEGGDHVGGDRALGRERQPVPVVGADVHRECRERFELRIPSWVRIELGLQLLRHARDRGARRHPASIARGAHACDQLRHAVRYRVEPLQPRFVVTHRDEARDACELRQLQMQAAELRHRRPRVEQAERQRAMQALELQGAVEPVTQHAQRYALLRCQRRGIEPCGAFGEAGIGRAALAHRHGGFVAQAIGVAMVAEVQRCAVRIRAQHPLPVVVEQRVRGRTRGARVRVGGRHGGCACQQRHGEHRSTLHDSSLVQFALRSAPRAWIGGRLPSARTSSVMLRAPVRSRIDLSCVRTVVSATACRLAIALDVSPSASARSTRVSAAVSLHDCA